MRVLICGGGQVGALTARRLIREGNEVTIVDPDPELGERCGKRRQRYRELYKSLRERFPRPG